MLSIWGSLRFCPFAKELKENPGLPACNLPLELTPKCWLLIVLGKKLKRKNLFKLDSV